MKRNIEIDDTLADRVDNAIDLVRDELEDYLKENKPDECPDLGNDLDYSGAIHEIVDGCVPIYTSEIKDTWYLHEDKLIEAYENAGVGDNPHENNGGAAIYFYIHQEVCDWYSKNAEDIFNKFMEGEDGHS